MTEPRPGADPATRAAWWEADDALSVALFLAENPTEATELVKAEVDRLRADLADARRVNAEAWRRIETAREIAVRHHADSFPALRGGRWRWEQVITALSGTDDAALSVGGTDRTEGDGGHPYAPTATSEFGTCGCGAQWNDPVHVAVAPSGGAADTSEGGEG